MKKPCQLALALTCAAALAAGKLDHGADAQLQKALELLGY